jgi:SagB-type dehydrogenase family enzyme
MGQMTRKRMLRRQFLHGLASAGFVTLAGSGLLNGCAQRDSTPGSVPAELAPTPTFSATTTPGKVLNLPAPRTTGALSLEETLARRRSIRAYTAQPLALAEIAQLFWAAQGTTRSWGGRTAPSAGALYPLELYAATAEGVYHYLTADHRAELKTDEDRREALWAAGLQQEALQQAAATFVFTAIYERTAGRYGERAERYVKLEAGHAAENLLLQAVALGLGAVVIGAFYDDDVAAALAVEAEEEPLYLIPVGHPAE